MFYCNHCNKECEGEGKLCPKCEEQEKVRIQTIFENRIRPFLGVFAITSVPILVWEFDKAPVGLQELSTNGGDEDWLVYVPAEVEFNWVPRWVESMDSCNMPDEFVLPNGAKVYIGSHA
jgi:hypothetical protein